MSQRSPGPPVPRRTGDNNSPLVEGVHYPFLCSYFLCLHFHIQCMYICIIMYALVEIYMQPICYSEEEIKRDGKQKLARLMSRICYAATLCVYTRRRNDKSGMYILFCLSNQKI
jgi:hypothetical protein